MRGPSLCSRCCCAVLSLLVVHVCLFALVVFTEKKKKVWLKGNINITSVSYTETHIILNILQFG